jgi:hypothetical protein
MKSEKDCKCEEDFEKKFEEKAEKWAESCGKKKMGGGAAGGGFYGLGFLGAANYFISHAGTFWIGVLGFLKALVWPAFLVYKLLEFLKM